MRRRKKSDKPIWIELFCPAIPGVDAERFDLDMRNYDHIKFWCDMMWCYTYETPLAQKP